MLGSASTAFHSFGVLGCLILLSGSRLSKAIFIHFSIG